MCGRAQPGTPSPPSGVPPGPLPGRPPPARPLAGGTPAGGGGCAPAATREARGRASGAPGRTTTHARGRAQHGRKVVSPTTLRPQPRPRPCAARRPGSRSPTPRMASTPPGRNAPPPPARYHPSRRQHTPTRPNRPLPAPTPLNSDKDPLDKTPRPRQTPNCRTHKRTGRPAMKARRTQKRRSPCPCSLAR